MPVYQYECDRCRERFDFRKEIGEVNKELKCPQCGAESVRRVYSVHSACAPGDNWCMPRGGG
ncbi:MAG: zinc ribbon domain-containing protein [Chloroflexi bacterium]|nr:zinc ribbon domain-containing protein [Chloroflexota bacterium]